MLARRIVPLLGCRLPPGKSFGRASAAVCPHSCLLVLVFHCPKQKSRANQCTITKKQIESKHDIDMSSTVWFKHTKPVQSRIVGAVQIKKNE